MDGSASLSSASRRLRFPTSENQSHTKEEVGYRMTIHSMEAADAQSPIL